MSKQCAGSQGHTWVPGYRIKMVNPGNQTVYRCNVAGCDGLAVGLRELEDGLDAYVEKLRKAGKKPTVVKL